MASETPNDKRIINYKRMVGGASAIVLANIMVILVGRELNVPALEIAGVGIITFFGTLSLADYATQQLGYSKGEMRTAITASVLITYFVIMANAAFPSSSDAVVPETVITNFGYVVWIVLGSYFGTRMVEIIRGSTSANDADKSKKTGTTKK